jgi:outer membrane protein assembly factor BamB
MDKELTFHPETERTRDLIYSEYSSCDRSLHLLFHESAAVPYNVLLKAYRETIATYLSSEDLRPPVDFLKHLLGGFDRLCVESGLPIETWKSVGIHLLLRSVSAIYLLTSRESEVQLCSGGRMLPLVESGTGGVERLRLDPGGIQQELFPQRFSDFFGVLKLDPGHVGGKDLVLGCAEGEKGAVLEALAGPVWLDSQTANDERAARRLIVSRFVSRKVLVVRFGTPAAAGGRISANADERSARRSGRRLLRRRLVVAAVATVVVAILIGVLWRSESVDPRGNLPGTAPGTREPSSTGRVTEHPGDRKADPSDAGERGPKLTEAWRKTYQGEVTSSPVLFDGRVVFGCRDGNLYALERDTGTLLWKFAATAGIGASAVVRGERVVVADYNGRVYAVEGRTGKEIWSRGLPMKVVSTPEMLANRLLVGCFDGYGYCLSMDDGKVLWKRKTKGRIRGSPASSGDVFFLPSYDGFLYALSAETGSILWRCGLGGPVSGTPAVDRGVIVVGGPDGRVYCLDATSGMKKWTYSTGAAVKSSAAIAGGRAFVGSNDSFLYCLNLGDGSMVWKFKTGDLVLGRPLVKNGIVYAGSYDGRLYALDASNGRLLDAFDTGGPVYSSPAADDKNVYFGTNQGNFICLSHHDEETS